MSLRLAILILVAIAAWKLIAARRRVTRRSGRSSIEATRPCPDCGAYVLARHPEPCARPDCRFRSRAA